MTQSVRFDNQDLEIRSYVSSFSEDEDENVEEEFESNESKSISCEKCFETFDRTCVFKRHNCHS